MTDINLAAYQGKKVKFKAVQGEEQIDMEGLVVLVNGPAMLLKPRGSSMQKLIELRNIVDSTFEQVFEAPREIKARELGPLTLSNARNHLLDRHGYELTVVNVLTDEAAFLEHGQIDHDRLGHFHTAPASTEESTDEG